MLQRSLVRSFAALTFCACPALPQSWSASPPAPTVSFGAVGDLLTTSPQGLIGFDELQGETLLPLGGGWTPLQSSVPPRVFSTMTATSANVFVFGGLDATTNAPRNDIWMWDLFTADWLQLTAGGAGAPGPSPRSGSKAAPWDDGWSLVFFGGADANGLTNDTWVMLQASSLPVPPFWALQPTPAALVGRIGHAMCRGPNQRAVLFGGDDGAPLGDTWLFGAASGWTQHTGLGPPAASDCRMSYDRGRDMTVLVHPNGDTWEWNGFAWRRVGASGAPTWSLPAVAFEPGAPGRTIAVQQELTGTVAYRFTPSPARFEITLDATCNVPGMQGLQLTDVERSLPILGEDIHLRVIGVPPASLLLGAYELTSPAYYPLGCGCTATLSGVETIVEFLPYAGGTRDWYLAVANFPALVGASVELQGFVVDPANPCWLMTTQSARLTPGR